MTGLARACGIMTAFVITLAGCQPSTSQGLKAVDLGFFIAVNADNAPHELDLDRQRAVLREHGAEESAGLVRWLPIANRESWGDGESQGRGLEGDPSTPFERSRNLVRERKGDTYYLLVHSSPKKCLYSAETPLGIDDVVLSRDNLGRPSVVIQLDAVGGQRLRELTARHVGEPLAIVVNGRVYSAPILRSPLGHHVMITGGFTEEEAQRLRDQLR